LARTPASIPRATVAVMLAREAPQHLYHSSRFTLLAPPPFTRQTFY
jgi:hypothetical protein